MDNLLADRLREAEVEPKAASIAALEQATASFVEQLAPRDVPELLRLVCSKPQLSDFGDRFRQHFRAADELFPLRDENHYVSVVALNALVQLFQEDQPAAVFGALAARCARFCGWEAPHPDLYHGADAKIRRAGVTRYPSQIPPRLARRPASVSKALEAAAASADGATAAAAIGELGTEMQRIGTYSSSVGSYATALVEGLAEQVRIMWWLLSGWSEMAQQRLDEIPSDLTPLILAIELADMTGKEPGPPSTDALLHQALLVAGVNPEDQISLSKSRKACAERGLALPTTHEWVADLTLVVSALDPEAPTSRRSIQALALARELFDELLLIRTATQEASEG